MLSFIRIALTALGLLAVPSAFDNAKADSYRWCADLTINWGGATNCYFRTLEQCRATVSGVGGYCKPNPFYDGRNDATAPRSRRRF